MNQVATIPERHTPLAAGAAVRAIVPQTMEEAYRLATAVVAARMAPSGMDTPEACMIAIMHGLEIGLTPMAALQRIAVVNGRPTLWGDGAMGLVRASGACEYVRERMEGEGDARTAICEAKRRGDPEPITRKFSVADAKRAGLWSDQPKVRRKTKSGEWYEKENDSPWFRFPERMLQMRARAFALRDGFADVLGGMYLAEELQDGSTARDITPVPSSPPAVPSAPPPAPPTAPEPQSGLSEQEWANKIEVARNKAELAQIGSMLDMADLSDESRERLLAVFKRRKATLPTGRSDKAYGGAVSAPPAPPPPEPEPEPEELPPLEPYDKAITDWMDSFAIAENLEDLDGFYGDEVEPYIKAGMVFPPDRDRVDAAYNAARAKL